MKQLLALLLFLPSLCLAQLPDYLPSEGLVAWYPLNGTGEDMSELSNHLDMDGTTPATDRWSIGGGAAAFDGSATMSNLSFDGIGVNESHTVAFWEKHSAAEVGVILCQRTGPNTTGNKLHYGYRGANDGPCIDGGCMGMDFYSVQHFTPFTAELETWNHWTLTYNGTTLNSQIFLNGTLVSEQPMAQPWTGSFDDGIVLGTFAQTDDDQSHFTGVMDDFGIWNRILEPEEIAQLYSAPAPHPGCTDPVACNFHPEANVDDGMCTYLPDPIELGADIYTCDSTVQLEAGGGFDAYLWSNGETTSSIEVTEIGDYAVEAILGDANLRAVQLHAPTILESSTDPLINGIFAGLHPFSVSLWVKADQLNGVELCDKGYSNSASGPNASSMQLFSGADGLSFQLFTDANHWMGLSTAPATGLLEGEWNHVVCTYDGGTTSDALRMYVNGADLDAISTPIQQGTFSGLHANTEPMHFGGRTSASGVNAHPLDGLLDDIFVFDQALSASQVEQLLTCGICWTPTCHWDFEETDAAIGDLIEGTFASGGTSSSSLYSPSFPGNALLSPSAEVRSIHPQCLFTDSISVTLVPCNDLPSLCGEGTIWSTELNQCVEISEACAPSCGPGTVWDPVNEECIIAISADLNYDGCVTVADLLELLAVHGTCPPYPEWPDEPTDTTWTCGDPLTYWDYDYATVLIGDQCWFAENARHLSYVSPPDVGWEDDGEPHAYVVGYSGTSVNEAMAVSEYTTYGALYNFAAVEDSEMCPSGWHVPTASEWDELENFIGILSADQLKAAPPIWDGTNELGFNAIRVPVRISSGSFGAFNVKADFWTSTSFDDNIAWGRELNSGQNFITHDGNGKNAGQPVRCIKD